MPMKIPTGNCRQPPHRSLTGATIDAKIPDPPLLDWWCPSDVIAFVGAGGVAFVGVGGPVLTIPLLDATYVIDVGQIALVE
ncbi:hypothetical protein COLO4_10322 [Corchorus olitorius]|uniref:Uncharacterized protein n=1 Tax=Corchorus olitorius TaxID=93759 RepID=A0A1R3K942_9ROSI|nr:hypothetical protein COLO4_10322 [Corchorus olitorius]